MFNLGVSEIVVILVVALVFLGPKKLPELASGLGKMIRELRKATSDIKNEIELDETIRKPVEELREAMTLHPEELKRRDRVRAERAQEEREAKERAEKEAAEAKATPAVADETSVEPAGAMKIDALNADKTIAMASPFPVEPAAPGPLPKAAAPVARPTLMGMAPAATLPRPAGPPPTPAASKLPPPPSGIRPVPSPPAAKKD